MTTTPTPASNVKVGDTLLLPGGSTTKVTAIKTGYSSTLDANGVHFYGTISVLRMANETVQVVTATTTTTTTSGNGLPTSSLPGWALAYSEDFTTAFAAGAVSSAGVFPVAYPKLAAYQSGWQDTSKKGVYSPQLLSVHDSFLDIPILTTSDGVHHVNAPTVLHGQSYGRYAVRFRLPSALPGYKTAWLLWPDSEKWPTDGEIDFPEENLDSSSTVQAFMHYALSTGGQDAFSSSVHLADGLWHTAIVEWLPGSVKFFMDGTLIGTSTKNVPVNPMHWVLQTETNLDGAAIDPAVSGHLLVDWVAVWTKA